jgi:hypothetical protein
MATDMIDAEPAKHSIRKYRKHGLGTMKRAITHLGSRSLGRRTSLGQALDQWRGQLISEAQSSAMLASSIVRVCRI